MRMIEKQIRELEGLVECFENVNILGGRTVIDTISTIKELSDEVDYLKNIIKAQEEMIKHRLDEKFGSNGWIPCGERLPEDFQECIITFVNHEPESYYADIKDVTQVGCAVYFDNNWYWYTPVTQDILMEYHEFEDELLSNVLEVIAWQPLPEPYEN